MLRNASPSFEVPRRPRFVRAIGTSAVVTLLGGVAAAYQLEVRADRPPSFAQGGDFLESLPAAGQDGRPFPYGDAYATTTTAPTSSTAATGAPAAGGPAGVLDAGAGGAGAGAGGGTGAPDAGGATTAPGGTPADPLAATTAPLPGTGVYTYAVSGTESASGFGSRSFPSQATVVVHGDPSIPAGALVHDLHLSDQHEEREIIAYSGSGAAFLYEAGSVTFGPGTQTSQGSYDPPMVQVPWPLADGVSVSGSSPARDGGGNVTRTERWTTTVVGREVLDVLGTPRETWVVDVQRNADGAERVDRYRRYWYDPVLGTWVRWTERFHGERAMLVTFTYDAEYTATLVGFTPG